MRNERGFALVITLIVTALLVALVVEFVNDVYVDTSSRQNFIDGQQASLLAESGVAGGIKVLQLTMASQQFTSLLDMWAKPLKFDDEQGSIEVTIEDEAAKINLNSIAGTKDFNPDYQLIANRLLKKLGLSTDLLDGLADWVDDDEVARPAGGETAYYQSLKTPHGAKNARFDSVEELGLVKGIDGKTFARLRPFVTVYADVPLGQMAPVNVNTAPPEVLAALDEGLSDEVVARIVDHRKTTPFKSAAGILSVPGMEKIGIALQSKIQATSSTYRLISHGRVKDTTRIIEVVARVAGNKATILYWREY